MKLIRRSHAKECALWEFFKTNLPPGLRAVHNTGGYGDIWGVDIKTRNWKSYIPFTDGIATIDDERVVLRHPQYFSDFEDIIRKYETHTGKEVEFQYWESP